MIYASPTSETGSLSPSAGEGRKTAGSPSKRVCILVLGMHRSGTSALTRAISLMGAALPKNMLGSTEANELGHWEPERLIALHERMLGEAGSHWDDWRAFDLTSLPADRAHHYRAEIRRIITEEYEGASLFVLKEPRISRFVPLYAEILASMNIDVRYLLAVRHPLEVTASLEARDGLRSGFSALLWLGHELEAEHATRDKPRLFVSYEAMLNDCDHQTERFGRALALDWPLSVAAATAIHDYVSPKHRHNISTDRVAQLDEPMLGWMNETYAMLSLLAADHDESTARIILDQVRANLNIASAVLGRAVVEELNARQQRLAQAQIEWQDTERQLTQAATKRQDELELQLGEMTNLANARAFAIESFSAQVGRNASEIAANRAELRRLAAALSDKPAANEDTSEDYRPEGRQSNP